MMTPEKTQQLFDALELDALPADDQEEVLLTMGELIFKDTLIRCLEAMSERPRGTGPAGGFGRAAGRRRGFHRRAGAGRGPARGRRG
jgi:hypothetical protein